MALPQSIMEQKLVRAARMMKCEKKRTALVGIFNTGHCVACSLACCGTGLDRKSTRDGHADWERAAIDSVTGLFN
jgi:hypothetical protein